MQNTSPLAAIRRRWWIIALLAAFGGVVGAMPRSSRVEEQATTFSATHTMLANNTDAAFTSSAAISPNQVSLLATTGEVPARVADALDYSGNPAQLASQVAVGFDLNTGALTFTTTQDTAERAELLSDTFADLLNSYLVERQDVIYQERLNASRERLESLEAELDAIGAELAAAPEDPVLLAQRDAVSRQYSVAFEQNREFSGTPTFLSFTTLQRAQAIPRVDRGLSAPASRRTRAAMGLVVGGAVGTAVAVLLGRLDRRIRTREQAEGLLGMRARVSIPKVHDADRDGLVVTPGRYDLLSDAYRTLRNVIGVVHSSLEPAERGRVTVVVSPGQGDGKTSLVANLAGAFVETGQRTVAINTDFRRPRLGRAIDETVHASLPMMMEDVEQLEVQHLLAKTTYRNLLFMDMSGVDAPTGDLVRATGRLLPDIAQIADSIVVDTSPVGSTAEVLEMVALADTIVVVVRLGHTQIAAAERTISILRDLSTAPLLLALTGVRPPRERYAEYGGRDTRPIDPDLTKPIRSREDEIVG